MAQTSDLEVNRSRWRAAGIDDYEYGDHRFCECYRRAPPETIVTVRQGKVVRVHHRHADSSREVPAREGSLQWYWTIDDLFALIEFATDREAQIRVRYDENLGYPVQVYVDYDSELVGDEIDVRLTRFQPLGL